MKQHTIFKILLLLLFGGSGNDCWAQEEKQKGKFIDNIYVIEERLLDASQLQSEQQKQYQQQLNSLRKNARSKKETPLYTIPDLPEEITFSNTTYKYVNGNYYEPKGLVSDYWVAQFGLNILEYRQNRNQINPGRPKKIEFFNKSGKVFKTLVHDKINPYIKYKNLKWDGIDYADRHHGFANQKPMEADNYIFHSTTKYSNGYLFIYFHLFSLIENLVLKGETTLFIFDTKGNVCRKIVLPHIIEKPEITEDGRYLSFGYGSATENPLDFNKNGYVQIYDLFARKVFYEEYGTKEYTLYGVFLDENTELYNIDIDLKKNTKDRIFKFLDVSNKTIYSKYYTGEEMLQRRGNTKYHLSELMQYDLFNQQKIEIK